MANKITTANSKNISQSLRFESRHFYNRNSLLDVLTYFGFEVLDDVVTLSSGSTPEHFDFRKQQTDAYLVKSADVKRYNFNRTTLSFTTKEIHNSRKNKFVFPNDILISNTGKYLGFACLVPSDIKESTTNQNIARLRLKKVTNFTASFLTAYLNSYFGQQEIESLLTLTGQKYLNSSNLKKLRVPKFSNEKITIISDLISLINQKDTLAFEKISQAQSLFYSQIGVDFSAIEKENVFSVQKSFFADSDLWTPTYSYPLYVNTLKTIQSRWKTVKLGDIVTFKKGDEVGSDNYIGYLDKRKTDVPFIRTSDIVNYETDQYPDYFISEEIYKELNQDIKAGDVLFSKDGKIGMVGMLTKSDKVIIASGFCALRLKKEAEKYRFTPEYLFLVLSIKEIGIFASKRRTVVASTIPHLREERLKEIEIPILEPLAIEKITALVKIAFELKDEKKHLIKEVREKMDSYFEM